MELGDAHEERAISGQHSADEPRAAVSAAQGARAASGENPPGRGDKKPDSDAGVRSARPLAKTLETLDVVGLDSAVSCDPDDPESCREG